MAGNGTPHLPGLLRLPRELRNKIYSELTIDCHRYLKLRNFHRNSKTENDCIELRQFADPCMRLLNRQIKEEYDEEILRMTEVTVQVGYKCCQGLVPQLAAMATWDPAAKLLGQVKQVTLRVHLENVTVLDEAQESPAEMSSKVPNLANALKLLFCGLRRLTTDISMDPHHFGYFFGQSRGGDIQCLLDSALPSLPDVDVATRLTVTHHLFEVDSVFGPETLSEDNRITYHATPTEDGSGWLGYNLTTVSAGSWDQKRVLAEIMSGPVWFNTRW